MQKITTFLWYDNNAEEALNFYTSIFKNAKIGKIQRYGKGAPMPEGLFFTASFELEGQEFMAMNAGPHFKFTEAISLMVKCKDQAEVDFFWEAFISQGGQESQCGWLKDKYGLSWQIIPDGLWETVWGKDAAGAGRAMQAMMQMKKIDVAKLEKAYKGE